MGGGGRGGSEAKNKCANYPSQNSIKITVRCSESVLPGLVNIKEETNKREDKYLRKWIRSIGSGMTKNC